MYATCLGVPTMSSFKKKLATLDSSNQLLGQRLLTQHSWVMLLFFFFESQSKGTLATWIHTPWIWIEASVDLRII